MVLNMRPVLETSKMKESDIKIMLMGDQKLMREGLKSMIRKKTNMKVVGNAGIMEKAIRMARQLRPNVILMDVNTFRTDGIEATRQIINDLRDVKIIALSIFPKKSFVAEMLEAGVSGYIIKDQGFDDLVRAIRTVLTGETFLCPKAASVVVDHYVHSHLLTGSTSNVLLTSRQREVLKLLAEGRPVKEIALILNISPKTVGACRRRIMDKLSIQCIAGLVKYAISEGLTTLDDKPAIPKCCI